MVLTRLQREICRLIADLRRAAGDSYLAGGATLNELIGAPRVSRDLDLFHDSAEALERSWDDDRAALERAGFRVTPVRERPSFVEAEVGRGDETVLIQWARDSAFRFFPLVAHGDLGLVLHPFDLATNKVLALVGRLEVRDWVDVIETDRRLQPLGFLAWAAAGKDPGFSPSAILEQAARTARYSADEVAALSFEGDAPDAAELARSWRSLLADAGAVVQALPPGDVGACVLDSDARLFRGDPDEVRRAVAARTLRFHRGSIRGALPQVVLPPRA